MENAPLVWVLQGKREGDNAQARELARRLGWPFVTRTLSYRANHALPNLLKGPGLATINMQASDTLRAPWPDLVIGSGKRMVPIGCWIKAQSGGKAKFIAIGRPRAPLHWFDLVITTPQYGLPAAGNLIEMPLPFAVPVVPDAEELAKWRVEFEKLPRPWIGVLVGGPSHPHRLEAASALALAARINQGASASVLVSTSPRTPGFVAEVLASEIPRAKFIYRWSKSDANPHQAILALADRFLVTSDSVSMAAEAIATGKPVDIFQLPRSPLAFTWSARRGLPAWLARHGIMSPPRDNRLISLEGEGNADGVLARIRDLMAGR